MPLAERPPLSSALANAAGSGNENGYRGSNRPARDLTCDLRQVSTVLLKQSERALLPRSAVSKWHPATFKGTCPLKHGGEAPAESLCDFALERRESPTGNENNDRSSELWARSRPAQQELRPPILTSGGVGRARLPPSRFATGHREKKDGYSRKIRFGKRRRVRTLAGRLGGSLALPGHWPLAVILRRRLDRRGGGGEDFLAVAVERRDRCGWQLMICLVFLAAAPFATTCRSHPSV